MAFDSASKAYFDKVEAVSDFDLTAIETWLTPQYVKGHIDAYVRGLKADGVWDGMLHTGLLVGPRTLDGVWQKLQGDGVLQPSITEWGYDPRSGIQQTNDGWVVAGSEIGGTIDNSHQWVWVPNEYFNANGRYISNHQNRAHIVGGASMRIRAHSGNLRSVAEGFSEGLAGWSRGDSTGFDYVAGQNSGRFEESSTAFGDQETVLFAGNTTGISTAPNGAKLSAYGTGTHVDLTKIRDRFAALRSALYSETESPVFGPSAAARRRLQAHREMQRGGSWL